MADDKPFDLEKMRSIGYVGKLTKDRKKSGREHPDSGLPYQVTTDENNNDVIEHGPRGAGVSTRQDVNLRPKTVEYDLRKRD